MSEFSANSLWSKLAFLLTHVGYAGLLFGFLWGGWSGLDFCGTRNNCDVEVVEFLFVVGEFIILNTMFHFRLKLNVKNSHSLHLGEF